MRALKFLGHGGVGLFTGFEWPQPRDSVPGEWVEAKGELVACGAGIHACRTPELPYWIDDELWLIELGGDVLPGPHGLIARRGRLLSQVGTWNAEVVRDLALACSARACETVGRVTGVHARSVHQDTAELQRALAELAANEPDDFTRTALAYAADTAEYATNARAGAAPWASCAAYTSALLAGYATARDRGAARQSADYGAERAWQAGWLGDRLGIDGDL